MKMSKPEDVDDYIASSASGARSILKELRAIVTSTVPKVEETISWGVPFYKYHGALAGFAVYENHVSFGGAAVLQSEDRKTLQAAGYKTGQKTVQIKFHQSVPAAAIKHILEAQARMNQADSA